MGISLIDRRYGVDRIWRPLVRRSAVRTSTLVQADVIEFRVPDDVTVVYAYNPFAGATFEAAMQALIATFDRRPRPMHLIYLNPGEHERLAGSGRFRLLTRFWRWSSQPDWMLGPPLHVYEVQAATPFPSVGDNQADDHRRPAA